MKQTGRNTSANIDWVLAEAVHVYTQPLPNLDGSPESHVADDLVRWMAEDRGRGGPNLDPKLIHYTPLAVLAASYVLVRTKRKPSMANQHTVLIQELAAAQLNELGLNGPHVKALMKPLLDALDADHTHTADGVAVSTLIRRSYTRYADFSARMFATIDPSPYPKGLHLSTKERRAIGLNDLTPAAATNRAHHRHELSRPENLKRLLAVGSNARRWKHAATERAVAEGRGFGMLYDTLPRIPKDTQRRNRERLDLVMNKIVAGSIT